MKKIINYYNKSNYDNMMNKIQENKSYNKKEKENLVIILEEMKKQNYLLNAIEMLDKKDVLIELNDFEKYKSYLIEEVYHEIYRQLLQTYKNYDEVSYLDIRDYFIGMTFNIKIINNIDDLFKEHNITIKY